MEELDVVLNNISAPCNVMYDVIIVMYDYDAGGYIKHGALV